MSVCFGVKAKSAKESYRWVEKATGLRAEARESSDWGGSYYKFSAPSGEIAKLLSNRDVYDNEPVVSGCDEWIVVLLVERANSMSPIVVDLIKDTEHFVLVPPAKKAG